MPVSVVCDAAAAASVVSAALRESIVGIGNSSNQINNFSAAAAAGHKTTTKNDDNSDDDDNGQNVQNKLIASTKRILLTKIEYEEVNNYNQSVLDTLKSKYIILKPSSSSLSSSSSSSPSSSHKNNNNNNSASGNNNSTGKINHLNGGDGGETEEDNNDKGRNQNTVSSQNTNSEQKQQQQLNGIKNDPNQLPQPKHVLYPRENVQIGWKNSSRKWQIGTGMINVGNTCYLNSTLQALFHVPAMANWLMSDSQHREKCEDECIICSMSKTLIASQSSQSSIKPYLIYTKLKLICKHLIMGRQEDAHEFLRYLVEAMEKSYLLRFRNWKELDQFSKETTPLNQILGGYLRSAVRCLACGHVSTTFQHFQDLLLDIRKANTIEEALDGYFSRERLEDMGYKCEACKKKVSATKQFSLERAPISLCIQLKRFSISGSKLLKPVTIRSRLDLKPYASKKSSTEHLTYRLVSMVTHLGISQHCGHYTAIGVTESGGYYQFDDGCVRSISLHNVMNTNTYIIFYELEDPQQHLTSSTSGGKLTSTQVSGEHNHQNSNNNNNDNNLVPVENFYSRKMNSNNNNDKSLVPIDNFLNRKLNGLFNNNNNENNIFQKQNSSQSSSSSSANNSETTKITNKSSETKDKFSTITTTPMIGPQLPSDKSLLNGYKNSTLANSSGTQNSQNQNGGLTSTAATNLPYYKLVNSTSKLVKLSSNGSSTNTDDQISSKSKQSNQQQTMNNSKLAIHFKNTNSANSYNNNAKSQHETNSPSKSQLSDTNKIQTESTSKKSENVQAAKSVLPNMPKLESPTQRKTNSLLTSSPIVAKNSTNKSDVNNSRNSSTPDSSAASTRNDKARISIKSIPIKSLVPYETDDDESSKDEFDKEINKKKTVRSNGSSNSNRNIKCNYDSLDDSSLSSSSSEPEQNSTEFLKSKTPPSPPVVKSKTGLWQVTSLNDTSSHTTIKNSTSSSSSATPERKNPFVTFPGISSSNFYSSSSIKLNGNGNGKDKKSNGSNNKKYEGGYNTENHNGSNGSAINQLLKLSHRGYGAPVLSWNGHKTEMEKEIAEETRLERKRELKDDEDTEMDRGKQKKMKMNNNKQSYNSRESSNPGYNPFQEYQGSQSQQQQHQRRWNNNNNNNSNNSSSSISNNKNNNSNSNSSNNSNRRYRNHNDGGILYNNNNRQNNNPFYRNNNHHHHNNFRNRNHHHRFNNHHNNNNHHHHQRSRNQRNGGGENRFHRRRDS